MYDDYNQVVSFIFIFLPFYLIFLPTARDISRLVYKFQQFQFLSYQGTSPQDILTPDAFFVTNMSGKALSKVTFGDISTNDVIDCFKVMPRSQVSINGIALNHTISPM